MHIWKFCIDTKKERKSVELLTDGGYIAVESETARNVPLAKKTQWDKTKTDSYVIYNKKKMKKNDIWRLTREKSVMCDQSTQRDIDLKNAFHISFLSCDAFQYCTRLMNETKFE